MLDVMGRLGDGPIGVLRDAADRLQCLEAALAAVVIEAIPHGPRGPFILTRATMGKIAAVYSPQFEVLHRLKLKCERNEPITEEDIALTTATMRQLQGGATGGT